MLALAVFAARTRCTLDDVIQAFRVAVGTCRTALPIRAGTFGAVVASWAGDCVVVGVCWLHCQAIEAVRANVALRCARVVRVRSRCAIL